MIKRQEEKAFYGWSVARFHMSFPNGNSLSTIWGEGSYTEEHDSDAETLHILGKTNESPVFNSDTVEIMFTCSEKLEKRILKKYNEGDCQPIGYLEQDKWIEIVNLLNKENKNK